MHGRARIGRVVLVVMDGLRAEAVSRLELPNLLQLAEQGASSHKAQTVSPSVTAAALTSLITGVPPAVHGIGKEGFTIPKEFHRLRPLTQLLAQAALPSTVIAGEIPIRYRWLARRIASIAGVSETCFGGNSSGEILRMAEPILRRQRSGFIFMHWPEADRAGHAEGWRSAGYEDAVRDMDRSLGCLTSILNADAARDTLLIACADHGGGGRDPKDHDSDHPHDTTIPVVLHGPAVLPTKLYPDVTLLDLPATVLWTLGVPLPTEYIGRPLFEAFRQESAAA